MSSLACEDGFYSAEVVFGVYAYGVELGFGNVESKAVFEQTELLQAFGLFQFTGGEGGEALKRRAAVGVKAKVLPVVVKAGSVAIKRDGRAREVECAAIKSGDNFYDVGVVDVLGFAGNSKCGDVDVGSGERVQNVADVFRTKQRFVALDVDVDVGVDGLRDGEEAVGSAGQVRRGHDGGPAAGIAEILDFGGVGGDDDVVEHGAGFGGLVDPR